MIKEALEFLAKLQTPKNPTTVDVGDRTYAVKPDGTLGEVVNQPAPVDVRWPQQMLAIETLQGMVLACNAKIGKLGDKAALHIVNHLQVDLVDIDLDECGKRRIYARALHSQETKFEFGKFFDPEKFLIDFRSSFYFNDEAVKVQQLCSTVTAGQQISVADDGISQEIRVVDGTVTKVGVTLPAGGVPLIPWRTFREVDPVESKFLLRMRGVKDGLPQMALFEIDAKWRIDTMNAIRGYLEKHLPKLTIIA